jgi:phosphate transport system ATP-binding protein
MNVAPISFTVSDLQLGAACCEPNPHFEIENLGVAYDGKTVLANVSLSIFKGCITALIGPSGCGKTSFLSVLNRLTDLIPNAQVSGHIKFESQDLLGALVDVPKLRQKVGFIFQKPNPFPLSIRRNLELPLKEHGLRDKLALNKKIEDVLRDVGLWDEVHDRLDSPALALSGGQQQRLCIARAIALEPSVLLMDEPCSALDPISSAIVEQLILRLRGRYTIVIVTHNLAQARRIANYAGFFWMKERIGNLIEFGQCQQLFDAPREALTAAYVQGVSG